MNISLSAFAPENLVSRNGFGSPVRVSPLISILRVNLVLTYGVPPEFRRGVHLFILNRHTPSGQSRVYRVTQFIAYRWRSLPRVRRHRASKPQGNSERVLPWQVTMDQLICAFSRTHYWYEVGMLKVPVIIHYSSIYLTLSAKNCQQQTCYCSH